MRSLCLAAFFALAGCTFDAETSDITVTVNNISQSGNTNHLEVTLTLADGPHVYHPQFGAQSTTSIELDLSSRGQVGPFTVTVQQLNRDNQNVGTLGTGAGVIPGQTSVQVNLP